ncbi:hypothetical protein Tco_1378482 [Tanacetum coccineum]
MILSFSLISDMTANLTISSILNKSFLSPDFKETLKYLRSDSRGDTHGYIDHDTERDTMMLRMLSIIIYSIDTEALNDKVLDRCGMDSAEGRTGTI